MFRHLIMNYHKYSEYLDLLHTGINGTIYPAAVRSCLKHMPCLVKLHRETLSGDLALSCNI